MPETSGLTIRQHERKSLNLGAEFIVADELRTQVKFSASADTLNDATVRGCMLDISTGGMGLEINCFIPKLCSGTVRVYSHTPSDCGSLGEPVYEPIFEHRVQIRRVYMASHDPTYVVGASFLDPEPDLSQRVEEVLIAARALAVVTDALSESPGFQGARPGADGDPSEAADSESGSAEPDDEA